MLKHLMGAVAALCLGAGTAPAQDYPTETIHIVVPYSAGGVTDYYGRLFQPEIEKALGQSVLVENKPGSGSLLGAMEVGRATPDGHTLLLGSYGLLSNQILLPESAFDPDSLVPVFMLGRGVNILLLRKDFPAETLDEVTAWAKDHPGELKIASSGIGASPHIAAELWADMEGIEFIHIPYKGTAPAMTDVIAGRVDAIFDGISGMAQVESGNAKVVAVAGEERHPEAADIPTFKELGKDFVFGSYFGFFVPAGTPQDVQDKLYATIAEIAARPEIDEALKARGLNTRVLTQQEFKDFMGTELADLQKLAAEGKLGAK